MKKILTLFTTGTAMLCLQVKAQDFKEHISKQFNASKTFAVYNLQGDVKVEGYDGNRILIEVDKKISGKTQEDIERGKKEFKINFDQSGDSVIVYISEPEQWDTRPRRSSRNYNWEERIPYNAQLDFVIKVPYNINLVASTINNGDVEVKDVAGVLK